MKVIAINGSPNMGKGNTALILTPFLEGMKEEGAETELFYTRKLTIKPCIACWSCLLKHPGRCVHGDDMKMLIPKFLEADVMVYATPVYTHGMTGPLKTLIERMGPLAETQLEIRDGRSFHPVHKDLRHTKMVLVSSCLSWELDAFDALVLHMERICVNRESELTTLLRPQAEAFKAMKEAGGPVEDITHAAMEAGRQMVRDGRVSNAVQNTISRELMPLEAYVQTLNQQIQNLIEAARGTDKDR